MTVPHYTPDASTSTPPLSSTSLSVTVALQHNADLLTPSDPPNPPSSASSYPVLDNVLPSPPLPSHSPTTRPDLSSSFPESHRAIIATAPSTSPGPSSALDLLSIAARDDGSCRHKDVGLPSVNRAIHASTMTTLDLPPQSLSRPSVADLDIVAIAGPSERVERTGDHSPHPSHCRRRNATAIDMENDRFTTRVSDFFNGGVTPAVTVSFRRRATNDDAEHAYAPTAMILAAWIADTSPVVSARAYC
ncbi:hypothetical protein EDB92DRAFT_1819159 [Lactarius akahatsu]|uniref:Uncharacterized protein n=1 Tax=Lactarius akahatsu TaxID=416441 RepID=A0AAD4L895_9AGAM|nr:hypothetical protein EDB92DRAFT_1819159 [Lactarius akahatsu]